MLILLVLLMLSAPIQTFAAVGISPASIFAEVPANSEVERVVHFSRDARDTATEMNVRVYASDGLAVVTSGVYHLLPGESSLTIPIRLSSFGFSQGEQRGVLYIEPSRVEAAQVVGNPVVVRGGVPLVVTVTKPNPPLSARERFQRNIRGYVSVLRVNGEAALHSLRSTLGV